MTKQEAFNIAVRGLREQKSFSVDENNACAYRGEGGTKCAIGFLVPDDLFGFTESTSARDFSAHLGLPSTFLGDLQHGLHDGLRRWVSGVHYSRPTPGGVKWDEELFEKAVRRFAKVHHLEIPA